MSECGAYETDRDSVAGGNCLAQVWAARPVVTGPLQGQSAYARTASTGRSWHRKPFSRCSTVASRGEPSGRVTLAPEAGAAGRSPPDRMCVPL